MFFFPVVVCCILENMIKFRIENTEYFPALNFPKTCISHVERKYVKILNILLMYSKHLVELSFYLLLFIVLHHPSICHILC